MDYPTSLPCTLVGESSSQSFPRRNLPDTVNRRVGGDRRHGEPERRQEIRSREEKGIRGEKGVHCGLRAPGSLRKTSRVSLENKSPVSLKVKYRVRRRSSVAQN